MLLLDQAKRLPLQNPSRFPRFHLPMQGICRFPHHHRLRLALVKEPQPLSTAKNQIPTIQGTAGKLTKSCNLYLLQINETLCSKSLENFIIDSSTN